MTTQISKSLNATTQQTGGAIWTPASGKKIALQHFVLGSYGATAGRLILWFGASGDTTYTPGTDQLVYAVSYAPSANGYPGTVCVLPFELYAMTADYILRVTTDAALSIDGSFYGYEF